MTDTVLIELGRETAEDFVSESFATGPRCAATEQIRELVRTALDQPEQEALAPDESRELFSLWLCHGMKPPEIYEGHPHYTGAMKLGAAQPHPEDGDPGRPLPIAPCTAIREER